MTQLVAMRSLDGQLHDAFLGAGFADVGFYTAPGANFDVRCRIYIDRHTRVQGEFGQVVGRRDEIALVLADVPTPAKGGRLLVESAPGAGSGEIFMLTDLLSDDGSLSRWVMKRV